MINVVTVELREYINVDIIEMVPDFSDPNNCKPLLSFDKLLDISLLYLLKYSIKIGMVLPLHAFPILPTFVHMYTYLSRTLTGNIYAVGFSCAFNLITIFVI